MKPLMLGLAAAGSLLLLAGSAAGLSMNNGWCTIPTRPGVPVQACQFTPSPDKPVGATCYCGSKKGKVTSAGIPTSNTSAPPEPSSDCSYDPLSGKKTCSEPTIIPGGPRPHG